MKRRPDIYDFDDARRWPADAEPSVLTRVIVALGGLLFAMLVTSLWLAMPALCRMADAVREALL